MIFAQGKWVRYQPDISPIINGNGNQYLSVDKRAECLWVLFIKIRRVFWKNIWGLEKYEISVLSVYGMYVELTELGSHLLGGGCVRGVGGGADVYLGSCSCSVGSAESTVNSLPLDLCTHTRYRASLTPAPAILLKYRHFLCVCIFLWW